MDSSDDKKVPEPAARPAHSVLWTRLALVGGAAAAAAVAALLVHTGSGEVTSAWDAARLDQPTHSARAFKLRGQALASCRAKAWTACKELLDQAKEIDPTGDEQPQVQALRTLIDQAALGTQAPEKP